MNYNNLEIIKIIKKYIKLFREKINEMNIMMDSLSEESLITVTNIVPESFFEGEKGILKNFGIATILFNDLKSSTMLIRELEDKDILYYYSYYMYYSSQMLAEILDLLDGKMVECTGDGNYSIFKNISIPKQKLVELHDTLKNHLITGKEHKGFIDYINTLEQKNNFKNYLDDFKNNEETNFINHDPTNVDERLRQLFFYIFAIFNIKVNKCFPPYFSNKFLTRVGCATGKCQIMRIENSHIRQDKLIGSVVHKSAHQASGKI